MSSRLLTCSVAVAVLMAGTRWASYIGVPPLFLTDVIIGLGVLGFLIGRLARPARGEGSPMGGRVLLAVVLLWVLLRLLTGSVFTVDTLRDAAPYVYVALAVFAGWSFHHADDAALEKTRRLFMFALWAHLAWFFSAELAHGLQGIIALPGGSEFAPVFTPRADIDAAMNAVLIGVLRYRVVTQKTRAPNVATFMMVVAAVPVFLEGSRAGLISVAAAFAFAHFAAQSAVSRERRIGQSLVIVLLLAVIFVYVPQTEAGQRLAGTFGSAGSSYSVQAGGTTGARVNAWTGLSQWMSESDSRVWFGVGFGPNFMLESGAIEKLIGQNNPDEASVRSPHDYWLGTWARLGLIGALPLLLLTMTTLSLAWRNRRRYVESELALVSALVVVCVVIIGSFGVVLESPFGAVPFWWCVGLVLAWSRSKGDRQRHDGGARSLGDAERDHGVTPGTTVPSTIR